MVATATWLYPAVEQGAPLDAVLLSEQIRRFWALAGIPDAMICMVRVLLAFHAIAH